MIRVVWLALSLTLTPAAHAGQVVLDWDFPLAQWPGTRFVLHIVTMQNGRPTQQERTIDPFTTQQCAQWPNPQRTPETLCGAVCLDPGDYTLSLFAVNGSTRSDASNVVDLDVTSTTRCQPSPVVPPPPAAPANATAGTVAGAAGAVAVGAGALQGSQASASAPSFTGMVNLACVSWTITGPCFCNPSTPCVSVEYWEPGWLVETVKKPGTTIVPLVGDLVQKALSAIGVPPFGGGGAGNAGGSGHTNLQYNETHVYTFPQLLGGPCTGCTPGVAPFTLHYASETDPLWRTAMAIPSPTTLVEQLGVWAPLYPRGGKAIHGSEPVGSAIAAARAMNIAFNPVGTPPNVEARVVLQPTQGTSTCCQLASPRQTPCFPVGTPPLLWETGTVSPRGTYAWIFWRKRTCCVNPAQATCGITLLGGQGANGCIVPHIPTP